jgi:hypothetical protein
MGRGKRCEIHPRRAHVRRHIHRRDRDIADARILQFARNDLGERTLQLGLDLAVARARGI